jgi:hypothetical protein
MILRNSECTAWAEMLGLRFDVPLLSELKLDSGADLSREAIIIGINQGA